MERREGKTKRPDPDEGRRSKVSSCMSKQQTDLEQAGHIRIAGLGIADDPYDDVLGEEEVLVEEATQTDDQEDSLGEDSDGQEDPLGEDSDDGNQIGDDSDGGNQLGDDCDSVYLVACHWDWYRSSKPCSVYKMMDVAPSVSSPANQRLQWVESLETDAPGKMFTTVRSRRRAWIVGVGGDHGSTVIFDTKTNNVIHGPILKSAKWCPVLAAVGEKVYAMSKVPSWKSDPDFPPWFEVLDLSKSRVITVADRYCLKGCLWREVPIPPCFPWKLSPSQYTILPIVMLMSYVVVDHYMLVSFNQSWGTLAFDTDSHEWHKVNDARLPFTGCAVKHGSIFLALSEKDGPISAYCIRLAPSGKDNALQLSVDVLAVKHEEHGVDAGSCFSSLDNKHFCSLSVSLDKDSLTFNRDYKEWFPKEALVNLTTYQIDNSSIPVMSKEAQLHVKQMISVSSKRVQDIKISSSHGFSAFGFSLLSI